MNISQDKSGLFQRSCAIQKQNYTYLYTVSGNTARLETSLLLDVTMHCPTNVQHFRRIFPGTLKVFSITFSDDVTYCTSGHISGYKGEWYITKGKLHIAIPISDTTISVNADTFEYSVNGNTLYLDGNAYTRITETPDRSSAASSLVGTWVIDGSASDEYPTQLKLKKDGTGTLGDEVFSGCFWCIDEDMLYYETQRFEYCFFTYRMEGKTLYLDDVAYTKR